jgi:hypothetical protein
MPALAFLSNAGCDQAGRQEMHDLSDEEGWLTWIAPPYIPFAPALAQHGVDVSRVLVIHSRKQLDALWATELALRSSVCVVVLAWLDALDDRSMRRLQLAAEAGRCWAVIFRPGRFISQASPAPVRMHLQPADGQLEVNIVRNRYGSVGSLLLQC